MSDRKRALLVLCVIVAAHAPSFARPLLDSDEAVYASIAALVNAGGRLYAEGGVDNKFPGIYFTYAGVFRVFGRYAMGAVHALALGVVLATSLVLARIAWRIAGTRAALFSALLYGVLTTFYYPKMLAANTEIFMMLPLSLSVLLSMPSERERSPTSLSLFAAGALIAIAAMYRQLAALNLFLSCLAPLLSQGTLSRRLTGALLPGLGFAAAFGVLFGTFAWQGTLHDFWFWTVSAVTTRYLPGGWAYRWPGLKLLSMALVMIVPWTLVALRTRRFRQAALAEKLVWVWLPISVAAVLVLWRFHPHYIIHAVGPLAVLAALELDRGLREWSGRSRTFLLGFTTALLALPTLIYAVVAMLLEPIAGGFPPPKPNYPRVARYMQETTTTDQRVFVWGAYSALYVLSDRLPASRFVGFMRGCPRNAKVHPQHCWDSGNETWPLLAKDLKDTPAELIVDTAAGNYGEFGVFPIARFPVLQDIVSTQYSLERTIEGVDIYRRR